MNALPANHRPAEALPAGESAASLLARARTFRAQARTVNPVLADAYRRRAAELSLEAWARAVHDRPVTVETVQAAVAAA
jgi:hypothetical protein